MKKTATIIVATFLLLCLAFGMTFIPGKITNIAAANVSKISIFDGNTGNSINITNEADINHIISNLNEIKFQKGKPSFGYMGYSYKTTIYNKEGKVVQEIIINSSETIRYKGFFYTAKDNPIDYNYIQNLISR